MDSEDNIFNSFTYDMLESIPYIEDDESYRWRFSKKRKHDEISYMIDEHSIIYDTDSESEFDSEYNADDLVDDYITNDYRVWRRNYIRKYKCKR